MKKFIIYLICFIVLIFGAKVGYESLNVKYTPDVLQPNTSLKDDKNQSGEAEISGDEFAYKKEYQAIDFEVLNETGEMVKLSSYFGKPIVVNFWATWCGPCQAEIPEFIDAYEKYGEDVEFLMVNLTDGHTDTVESVKEFVNENKYDFPLYFDTEYSASNAYQVYSIPQTLFVDEKGNIQNLYIGMIDSRVLESEISVMLAPDTGDVR
jgi:thiol-disulfide isomerase/thioredoxin